MTDAETAADVDADTPNRGLDGGLSTSSDAGDSLPPIDAEALPPFVRGRQLIVGDKPYQIRGVGYNPVKKGTSYPSGLDFSGAVGRDAALMRAAGLNTVRTYGALTDRAVLDALFAAGIRVVLNVYSYAGEPTSVVDARVLAVASHPALLMWSIGNEWNYNGLYARMSHADSIARLKEVALRIRALDTAHPIATIYGEMPAAETIAALPEVDLWGLNVYRGLSFGDLFSVWSARSDKPLFLGEYGADAYNTRLPGHDPASQEKATRELTQQLLDHSSAQNASEVCTGGLIFEWADEWWKDEAGNPNVQDVGGSAPGAGPYPDNVFNEEWWGLVDIDRKPRPAYDALKSLYK